MSTISNRFYITALEDGTTLHGNLNSTKSLTQAWNGTSAIPDWTDTTNQPIIYLSLLSGSSAVNPDSNYKWFYNDQEIIFNSSGISTSPMAGVFKKTTYPENNASGAPALKIIGNLASNDNVDTDLIRFEGAYTISSAPITFASTIMVRISRLTGDSAYLGLIEFQDGIANITYDNQSITMIAQLYDHNGAKYANYDAAWYLNDVLIQASGKTLTITEDDILDNAIVRCEFYSGNEKLYTAYTSIDDTYDDTMMYIQYDGGEGHAASLRKDSSVTFDIWVGTNTDPTPNEDFTTFKVKFLRGDGSVIGNEDNTGLPTPADGSGWRPITYNTTTKHASVAIAYDTVKHFGKNITGIVMATSGS